MDDISYDILSHGHYFIEGNIVWCMSTQHNIEINTAKYRMRKVFSNEM
jgi:hypothetical protein